MVLASYYTSIISYRVKYQYTEWSFMLFSAVKRPIISFTVFIFEMISSLLKRRKVISFFERFIIKFIIIGFSFLLF